MEDFYDVATVFVDSAGFALGVSLAIGVPIYLVLRMIPAISRFRPCSTWKVDAKSVGIFATVIFALTFVPSLLIGSAFSTMCGTGDITEVSAPDDGHKIVVYNFDCGATTDFSFDVSLLRGNQKLPKYRAAKLLYSHYHQRPTNGPGKNFQIDWLDPTHVVVHIANFDGIPRIKEQDGIEIIFKPLP